MITQAEKKYYTPEEYLEWEITSEERHDYRDGEIIPVTGGTPNDNEIAGNLYIALRQGLKNRAYRTFYADQRLWIPNQNLYTYPDVMVVETPLKLQPGRTDTIMNPCLIAEILSKSTRDYGRSEKFLAYRSIDSFREYLIIDQYRVQVEHFVKTGNKQWLMSEYTEGEATISLNQLNVELNIADLYANV